MKMKRSKLVTGTLAFAVLVSPAARAPPGGGRPPPPLGPPPPPRVR